VAGDVTLPVTNKKPGFPGFFIVQNQANQAFFLASIMSSIIGPRISSIE
jgi:hypothetical protein